MRRTLTAIAVLALAPAAVLATGGPPAAAQGLLHGVPRAQFVDNVPLGRLERLPAPPVLPTPKVVDGDPSDWEAGVRPTGLGGTLTVQAGQLIYQDWILDDSGAARACYVARRDRDRPLEDLLGWSRFQALDSAAGEELVPGEVYQGPAACERGLERYGAVRYPSGATAGSADLLELRLAADAQRIYVLVRLNAMGPADEPVVALAVDDDPSAPPGDWGLGAGVATPGADHVITITRRDVLLDGVPAAAAAVASSDAGFGGLIEASLPRFGPPVWRLWAGTGLWDRSAGRWRTPEAPEPGPAVFNLAFRGDAEPLRAWMEEAQAIALRRAYTGAGLPEEFSVRVDLDALASGAHETWRLRPGYYNRIFLSRVTDRGEDGGSSARQPYGLYVPTTYDPSRPTPMTVWLHWRGPGDHNAAYYVPNMVWELAESRGNLLISPRGRGSSGWYVGDSQVDVLDAMADAEAFLNVDRERVYLAGYSMGGWGAYLLGMLYPDRFAGAFVIVGPPALGAWPWPAPPVAPQNNRPLYFTNPLVANARYVPYVIFHGTNDELVPVSGTLRQALTFIEGRQPVRLYLFAGYEHYSFAVADEWSRGAAFLGNAARLRDPARVTYTRMPCLDPVHWSPAYAVVADAAYWVSRIAVRDAPSGAACTSPSTPTAQLWRTGTVDVTSHALPRPADAGGPVAEAGGPPDHTGAYVMAGYQPKAAAGPAPANAFEVSATNVSSFTVDAPRARLRSDVPLQGSVTTDAPLTITFAGLGGGTLYVDGEAAGPFTGTLTVGPGRHTVEVRP